MSSENQDGSGDCSAYVSTPSHEMFTSAEVIKVKKERQYTKASVTRLLNKLKTVKLNEHLDEFNPLYDAAKEKFELVKELNDRLREYDPDQSEQNIESYLTYEDKLHEDYLDTMLNMKTWYDKGKLNSKPQVSSDLSQQNPLLPFDKFAETMQNVLTHMSLPKYELSKFHGDSSEYLVFRSSFQETVLECKELEPSQKLTRLYHSLGIGPQALIKSCLIQKSEESLQSALSLLDGVYGNPVQIAEKTVQSLIHGKRIINPPDYLDLHAEMQSAKITLMQLGRGAELDGQQVLLLIVNRIQNQRIVDEWKMKARRLIGNIGNSRYPKFDDLLIFVQQHSRWVNDIHYGIQHQSKSMATKTTTHATSSESSGNRSHQTSDSKKSGKCFYCFSNDHLLFKCNIFIELAINDKVKFIKDNKLCLNCISGKHLSKDCRSNYRCRICKSKHHYLLHGSDFRISNDNNSLVTNLSNAADNNLESLNVHAPEFLIDANAVTNASAVNDERNIWFPLLKVFVNDHPAIALVDACSTHSYIKNSFAENVGVSGRPGSCKVSTISGTSSNDGIIYDIFVKANSNSYTVSAYGSDNIPVPKSGVGISKFEHLSNLPLEHFNTDSVDLLLGNDMGDAIRPLEIRISKERDQPYAVRTELGWYVCGSTNSIFRESEFSSEPQLQNNRSIAFNAVIAHERPCVSYNTVHSPTLEDFKMLWNHDQDVGPEDNVLQSADDKYVISLWDNNVTVINNKIQLPIPIRSNTELPPSRPMAEKRLKSLAKRLNKENLFEKYDEEIEKLLVKGYAERVENPESHNGQVWYVPHHNVPKKNNKIRIVNDCAAKVHSKSINTEVLQGPDLNNALVGVLLRFRLYRYAAIGDIESMYMQVKVPEEQRDLLRFLWYDKENNLITFRMTSHLFGGVWSPAAAIYALKFCASQCHDHDVRAAIERSFYVDDLLISHDSPDGLSHVVIGTVRELETFGFNLRGIVSNDTSNVYEEAQSNLPENDLTLIENAPDFGALGIRWNVKNDTLSIETKASVLATTKRSILATVARVYDPLGIISPILLQGRQILKEVVQSGCGWDDPLPTSVLRKWDLWLETLDQVKRINVPRCVGYSQHCVMHVFADASSVGYGCCIYLVSAASSHLVCAKSKVFPSKAVTIPRLELCAAVLATKIARNVKHEICFTGEEIYWTDSMIVLGYINNSSSRYHTYVRNRVDHIQNSTKPEMWRYVPGKSNPADIASRGTSQLDSFWFRGPQFLLEGTTSWPAPVPSVIDKDDPEVRSTTLVITQTDVEDDPMARLIGRVSCFMKLKRIVSKILIFVKRCKKLISNPVEVNVEILKEAENVIFKHAQRDMDERKFKKLNLIMTDGLYRVSGRIKSSFLPSHQIFIPPGDNSVSTLLIQDAHSKVGHMGLNSTLAKLRNSCWIPRNEVKSVLSRCNKCKLLKKRTCVQKMSDLPPERLGVGHAPFHYTGLDCFGPFLVVQGRKTFKRWGLLFTCMTIRAIHIEKLDSMDTSSFLNGLERFVSRRGIPHKITCDNGLNFVRGSKELKEALLTLNHTEICNKLSKINVEWHFIPPYASHHGGIYERQIRTVRQVLTSMLHDVQYKLNDELLQTFFCQVEAIVNSRPITPLSVLPNDEPALSPSQLLQPNAVISPFPVDSATSNTYNKAWKRSHALVDCFWRRWIRSYLPLLQQRSKWLCEKKNIKIGDVVLIADPNAARCSWKLGKIADVKKGTDGLVRSADVLSDGKILTRPITKLVNLELV